MFDWYSLAAVCYVYLADVPEIEDPTAQWSNFRLSMWFQRGWTLQELLVPRRNVFLSRNWRAIGTKRSLCKVIEEVTNIDEDILLHRRPLHSISVARRMSWAQYRRTTRIEDEAYCLMGIFGVRIPAIYGEGRHAFVRLQEEIMKCIPDQSLFAWGDVLPLSVIDSEGSFPRVRAVSLDALRASKGAYLLASCPFDFGGRCSSMEPVSLHALSSILGVTSLKIPIHLATSHGVRITLPILTLRMPVTEAGCAEVRLALLACQDDKGRLAALVLLAQDPATRMHLVGGFDQDHAYGDDLSRILCEYDEDLFEISSEEWRRNARVEDLRYSHSYPRIALLESSSVARAIAQQPASLTFQDVCIPYQRLQAGSCAPLLGNGSLVAMTGSGSGFSCPCSVLFPPWTLAHFRKLGIVADVNIEHDGGMQAVYVPSSMVENTPRHPTFVLRYDRTTVTIALFQCPAVVGLSGPLHVSVAWNQDDEQDSKAVIPEPEDQMWLLDTTCYTLHLKQDVTEIPYAILSHVWDQRGEQTFQDVQAIHASVRQSLPDVSDNDLRLLVLVRERLSWKIRSCCDYACSRGLKYVWIDTCCIDKSSSAELSEAIISMFDWYSRAAVCYVFLADVPETEDPTARLSHFRRSVWFQRGWTLQELIAPQRNVFLSKNWRAIGTSGRRRAFSVARRMSWAQFRRTTRIEDEAYSLMGIFSVHIPAIYGEGRDAFVRLEEEIMKCIPDQSLFVWGDVLPFHPGSSTPWNTSRFRQVSPDELRASKAAYLLASSPVDFGGEGKFLEPFSLHALSSMLGIPASASPSNLITSHGVRMTMPILTLTMPHWHSDSGEFTIKVAILACRSSHGYLAGLILSAQDATSSVYLVGGVDQTFEHDEDDLFDCWSRYAWEIPNSGSTRAYRTLRYSQSSPRMIFLEQSSVANTISHHPAALTYHDICIPYQRLHASACATLLKYPSLTVTTGPGAEFRCPCAVILPSWTFSHLQQLGFTVDVDMQPSGEMLPAYIPGSLSDSTAGPRQFVLQNGTTMVTIVLFPYSALESYNEALEVPTIASRKMFNSSQQMAAASRTPRRETTTCCDGDHVDDWSSNPMCYQSPATDLPTVHLQSSVWDHAASSSDWRDVDFVQLSSDRCYVLDVRLEYPGNKPSHPWEADIETFDRDSY
ncbi:hypothetical protein C8Q70DRAFT_1059452 [Cubamyces menziesii]|nr:hypothetical protein C8Q70DRAFT_1059452 [Cubamyces menziesii]